MLSQALGNKASACEKRLLLARAVVKATGAVSEIRQSGRDALARGESADELVKPLQDALNARHQAADALETHRQQHGC
jgi:hypothetical protein